MPPENEGEKTRTEVEWKGLMTDKQNEVRARQQIQSELGVKNLKVTELEEKVKALEVSKDTRDPTETVTRAELLEERKKTKDELTDLYRKEKAQLSVDEQTKFVNKSFNAAVKKHTEEKDGKGLSFDDVMEGTKRQILENKVNRTLIENDTNPGEKAYQIGFQDSVIAERHNIYGKTLAEQKKIKKVGMDGSTTGGEYFSQARVKLMSREDIKLHYKEIQESRKTWTKDKVD